jgi:hypothetical protein
VLTATQPCVVLPATHLVCLAHARLAGGPLALQSPGALVQRRRLLAQRLERRCEGQVLRCRHSRSAGHRRLCGAPHAPALLSASARSAASSAASCCSAGSERAQARKASSLGLLSRLCSCARERAARSGGAADMLRWWRVRRMWSEGKSDGRRGVEQAAASARRTAQTRGDVALRAPRLYLLAHHHLRHVVALDHQQGRRPHLPGRLLRARRRRRGRAAAECQRGPHPRRHAARHPRHHRAHQPHARTRRGPRVPARRRLRAARAQHAHRCVRWRLQRRAQGRRGPARQRRGEERAGAERW